MSENVIYSINGPVVTVKMLLISQCLKWFMWETKN